VRFDHREVVTTTRRLIVSATDRQAAIVTKQQRADSAMPDKQHMSVLSPIEHDFCFSDNAPLCVSGAFPSSNTDVGLGEKLIGHVLELVRRQEASRRTIIFMHRIADFDPHTQGCGNRFSGRRLAAWNHAGHRERPASACTRARPTGLNPHDVTGAEGSICTCGWVK
jgi:hypothetical protein